MRSFCFLILFSFLTVAGIAQNTKTFLFVGNYTNGEPGNGLAVYDFNTATGELKELSHLENLVNPSFIDISPNGKFLYACTETKLLQHGNVAAYQIDSVNGKLIFINKQTSGGENPVYLSVHRSNRFVVNANYKKGSLSVFKTRDDGGLEPLTQIIMFNDSSVNKQRQETSHIHAAVFNSPGNYLLAPDLGADKIRVFKFETVLNNPVIDNKLAISAVPGSGPRHLVFHPKLSTAYCIEELSGMVSVHKFSDGVLNSIQRIRSSTKIKEVSSAADIHLSPDGLFLYASNRGEDNTLSIFSVDQQTGKLTLKGWQSTGGDHPRNFMIAPNGKFLLVANQASGTIVIFERDLKSGMLTRHDEIKDLKSPSCLKMYTYRFTRSE